MFTFFYISEGGLVEGHVLSNVSRSSPIPAVVEISVLLTFFTKRYITFQKMKQFVTNLYSYEYNGSKAHDVKSNDGDDDDADEDIHFDLTQQVEVCEKIDKGSDAVVVIVRKKTMVRLIVDSEIDDDVNACTSQKMNRYRLTPSTITVIFTTYRL